MAVMRGAALVYMCLAGFAAAQAPCSKIKSAYKEAKCCGMPSQTTNFMIKNYPHPSKTMSSSYGLVETAHKFNDADSNPFDGYFVYQDIANSPKRPGLLVFPGPWGNGDGPWERKTARAYAHKGMIVFIADYFTESHSPDNLTDAAAALTQLYRPFLDDSMRAQKQALLNWKQLTDHPLTDPAKIGVIGYCFGGAMALQLGRAGGAAKVAASLHGEYPPIGNGPMGSWSIGHFVEMVGDLDPLIPLQARANWTAELSGYTMGTTNNYDMVIWGNTKHAFAQQFSPTVMQVFTLAGFYNPESPADSMAIIYDQKRSEASFARINELFDMNGLFDGPAM